MRFTTAELKLILAELSKSSATSVAPALCARIRLAIAKADVAALTTAPTKPSKETK